MIIDKIKSKNHRTCKSRGWNKTCQIHNKKNAKNLKNLGLKATGPRLKILEIFQERAKAGEDRHLSAEEVYKELVNVGEDVGLATVYRVLAQFASAGILTRRNFEHGTAVFELDDGHHHDHLICVMCGKVVEFVLMKKTKTPSRSCSETRL